MDEAKTVRDWFHAAKRGNLDHLQESLMKYKVNHKEQNSGNTALILATYNGRSECVRWLVSEEGADINIRDQSDETALIKAARRGDHGIMKFLLDSGAHIDVVGVRKHTPLMHAACNGHENCLRLLVERKAIIDVVDSLGTTPLMKAAFTNNLACIKCLLKKGALVNITDNNGQTALIKAAFSRNFKSMKKLLKAGAHVNQKDHANSTALAHVVVAWRSKTTPDTETLTNDLECIKLLCRYGADINCVDFKNETPLMRAAATGFYDCVTYLVSEFRAKKDVFNNAGQTALALAAKHGYRDILKFLCRMDQENVKDVADLRGYTPLIHAAQNNKSECVKILVEYPVEMDVATHDGTTPLMAMALAGFGPAVQALISKGADPERTDIHGKTALDMTSDEQCQTQLRNATMRLD